MPILFEAVTKNFNGVSVLDQLSLNIADGSFVSIIGASGCGKSTLLNLAAGLSMPCGGEIVMDDMRVTAPGPDRVLVFQRPGLYPWLNLRDNIAFGLRVQSKKAINWSEVDRMITLMNLRGFETHKPYELSGGMQQRVALARALVMRPRVLLMDEPFAALDAQTRQNMQALLVTLWDTIRATVIFVTHDIDEAITLADRLVVMSTRPGRIALDVPVTLPRPRHWEMTADPAFIQLKREARAILAR